MVSLSEVRQTPHRCVPKVRTGLPYANVLWCLVHCTIALSVLPWGTEEIKVQILSLPLSFVTVVFGRLHGTSPKWKMRHCAVYQWQLMCIWCRSPLKQDGDELFMAGPEPTCEISPPTLCGGRAGLLFCYFVAKQKQTWCSYPTNFCCWLLCTCSHVLRVLCSQSSPCKDTP